MTQPTLGRVEESRVGVVPSPGAPPKTVPDVLRHAALIIEERGWCRGTWVTEEGAVCADGAVQMAMGVRLMNGDGYAYTDADQAFYETHGEVTISFNDAPGRTAAEVTAALRAAADAYER